MKSPARRKVPTLRDRASGVLLHVTSLPGPHGNGDLGAEAHAFAELLARSGQRWWQMLPVGPAGYGDSPYSAMSAFAGNPLLVDLDALGVPIDLARLPSDAVDYEAAAAFREKHLRRAFQAEASRPARERSSYRAFVEREAGWLDDFALFAALKRAHDDVEWTRWEPGVRRRVPLGARARPKEHAQEIALVKFVQWKFDEQWRALRALCTDAGVGLIGDLPIFVAHDSADVWQHPELFEARRRRPEHVRRRRAARLLQRDRTALGQPALPLGTRSRRPATRGGSIACASSLERFDAVRLDHFIGFVALLGGPRARADGDERPMDEGARPRAVRRRAAAARRRGCRSSPRTSAPSPPSVTRLRRALGLPGMRIVQFAFGDDAAGRRLSPAQPHRALGRLHGHARQRHDRRLVPRRGRKRHERAHRAQATEERRAALAYLGRTSPTSSEASRSTGR